MPTSTSTTERTTTTTPARDHRRAPVFAALMGVSALAVLLQGVWAGIFLRHPGHMNASGGWVDVHARGGEVALFFAGLATAWAFWKDRERKDLWLGGAVYSALLVVEAWVGGQIRDDGATTLIAVHLPLAMVCMALAVWLPLRASRSHRLHVTT